MVSWLVAVAVRSVGLPGTSFWATAGGTVHWTASSDVMTTARAINMTLDAAILLIQFLSSEPGLLLPCFVLRRPSLGLSLSRTGPSKFLLDAQADIYREFRILPV